MALAVLLMLPAARAQPQAKNAEAKPGRVAEKPIPLGSEPRQFSNVLDANLPLDHARPGRYYQVFTYAMLGGSTHTIDLMSQQFDPYLRVEDASGKTLAEDDDSGGSLNARIVFTAPRKDSFRIIATTSVAQQVGQYTLMIVPGRVPKRPSPAVNVQALSRAVFGPVRYGDIGISSEGTPNQMPLHGYVEYRFALNNTSRDRHRVQVAYPRGSESGGVYLSALTRTAEVGPMSQCVVSVFQPDLPMNYGSGAGFVIDGRSLPASLPVNSFERGRRLKGQYGSFTYQPLILCVQSVDSFALQRNWAKAGLPGLKPRASPSTTVHGFQFVQVPSLSCSKKWLGYSGYDGVAITSADLTGMDAEARSALEQYVECGGSLIVLGPWQAPKAWERTRKVRDRVARYRPGFGRCLVFDDPFIDRWSPGQWRPVCEAWQQSEEPWLDLRTPTEANEAFPVVASLTIPLRGMFLLMLIFAIVIGPVNLFVLARRKRRIWMLWTVPVVSVVTCLAVLGYMLASEGWQSHVRAQGITVLDESSHRATTLGWIAFYTPISPADGLHFSGQTELTAQLARTRGTNRPLKIDWTDDQQHLDSGWLTARVPTHFVLRKSEPRRERVTVRKDPGRTLTLLNGLGADLRSVHVMGLGGRVYAAQNVPAGKEAVLHESAAAARPASPDALRDVYRDSNWPRQVDNAAALPDSLLRPGCYVAVVEGTPFIEDGLSAPGHRQGRSVVYGIMKEPIDEN
jgi:hypothetical protein